MNRLLIALIVICILLVGADYTYEKHGHYAWEDWPAAQGIFGLAACAVLVLVARVLGGLLRRNEDYYGDD